MWKFCCLFLLFNSYLFGQNVINIENFGVNGLDDVDDTQKFDSAIEHICKVGGTLYIPKGNYYLSNKLRKRSGIYNNNYIFLALKSFAIKLDKDAVLHYQDGFKGFRFRSTKDPGANNKRMFSIVIEGGVIDGTKNFTNFSTKGNPDIWAFVAETMQSFKLKDLVVKNFKGSAAIASYANDFFEITNSNFKNVTGNPSDLVDNHGDAIYVGNTTSYHVQNNTIINTLNSENRIGRVGICIEYEGCRDGIIESNYISGYDRGIHVELIKGSANIFSNKIIGNSSGIVLWNNYNHKQIIDSNLITNTGLLKGNKSLLYTSASILMLGYNTNGYTMITNNQINLDKNFYLPNNILQVTSSNMTIQNNKFLDKTKSLSLAIAQGQSRNDKVTNINFINNHVLAKNINAYDVTELNISNNMFDVSEMIISFDDKANYYKNNKIQTSSSLKQIKLLGKYLQK